MAATAVDLLERLRSRTVEMLDALRVLVEVESPSSDPAALAACAERLGGLGAELLGRAPDVVEVDGRRHLHWPARRAPRIALLGHYDTVWPLGTLAARPFGVDGDRVTGPGSFDMKAGLVQGLFALAELGEDGAAGVEILVTADEEIGSPSSRELIEALGRRAGAVLVLEPSVDGHLKTARKGVAGYALEVAGRAAHAGLEPERGVNALLEMAAQVLAAERVSRPALGTTVTPTRAGAGVADNMVPPSARVIFDVRALSVAELQRVDAAMRAATPVAAEATLTVSGGINRPPLEASASADLFSRAAAIAARLGLPPLEGRTVGGGSDGNLTAAAGAPTLDGLGAVGAGAHADDEHVVLSAMPERAALVAALIADLITAPVAALGGGRRSGRSVSGRSRGQR